MRGGGYLRRSGGQQAVLFVSARFATQGPGGRWDSDGQRAYFACRDGYGDRLSCLLCVFLQFRGVAEVSDCVLVRVPVRSVGMCPDVGDLHGDSRHGAGKRSLRREQAEEATWDFRHRACAVCYRRSFRAEECAAVRGWISVRVSGTGAQREFGELLVLEGEAGGEWFHIQHVVGYGGRPTHVVGVVGGCCMLLRVAGFSWTIVGGGGADLLASCGCFDGSGA